MSWKRTVCPCWRIANIDGLMDRRDKTACESLEAWQLYDTKGNPMGNPDSVASPGSGAAGVTLRDGDFLLFP